MIHLLAKTSKCYSTRSVAYPRALLHVRPDPAPTLGVAIYTYIWKAISGEEHEKSVVLMAT